jgi:c-di-GMP-binding flagellar brake protein YcgR
LFNVNIFGGVYIFILFLTMDRAIITTLGNIITELNTSLLLPEVSIIVLVMMRDPNIGSMTFLARRRLRRTSICFNLEYKCNTRKKLVITLTQRCGQ